MWYHQIKRPCIINSLLRGIFMYLLVLFPKKGLLWNRIWSLMNLENLVDKLKDELFKCSFSILGGLESPSGQIQSEYHAINLQMVQTANWWKKFHQCNALRFQKERHWWKQGSPCIDSTAMQPQAEYIDVKFVYISKDDIIKAEELSILWCMILAFTVNCQRWAWLYPLQWQHGSFYGYRNP